MTIQLFGYDVIPPYEPYVDRAGTVSRNGALDQVRTGGTAVKYGFRCTLMPDPRGVRAQAAKIDAFRDQYGYTGRFDFTVPQEMGIELPSGSPVVRAGAAIARDAQTFRVTGIANASIEPGTRLQFAGFDDFYKVFDHSGDTVTLGRYGKRIVQAIPGGTAISFAPTAKMVFDSSEPVRIVYRQARMASIQVAIREQSG